MRPLDDHRHCKVCGKVTDPGSETCGAACASERERRQSSRQSYRLLVYVAMFVVAIVFVLEIVHG